MCIRDRVKAAIEKVRKNVAQYLGVSPSEIFFTSSGTEANNMAIFGSVTGMNLKHCITSPIEHHSILKPIDYLSSKKIITKHEIKLDQKGNIIMESLVYLLKKYLDALVCLTHANSEIGNLNAIDEISNLCQKYQAICMIDAIQTVGFYTFLLQKFPIHFLTASAHKFHGPKGIGFLYINKEIMVKVRPLFFGGSQENNMRAGTECVANIVGLGKALSVAQENKSEINSQLQSLKLYAIKMLQSEIPLIRFNGESSKSEKSINKIISISLPSVVEQAMMLYYLDIQGIAVSAGSACTSGTYTQSHVLSHLEIPQGYISIRLSFSKMNKRQEIENFVSLLKSKIHSLNIQIKNT